MKKARYIMVVVVLLILSIFQSFAFAAENGDLVLTLDNAIENAINNNRTIKIERINLSQTELDQKDTRRSLNRIDLAMVKQYTDNKTIANAEVQKNIGLLKLNHALELAKDKIEMVENQVKLQVKKSYYQVVELESMIKLTKDNLDYLDKQMKDLKLNRELGNVTDLDVLSMEIQIESAKNQLKQLQGSKEAAMMSLNSAMGLPVDNKTVVEKDSQALEFDFTLQASIEKALVTRMDVKRSEKDFEFKEKELEIYNHYLPEDKKDRKSEENACEIAEINLESVKDAVKIEVVSKYNNVMNMSDEVDIARLNIKKAEQEANMAQLKYDTKLITFSELIQVQNNLTNTKISLISAVHSYNNAVEEFVYAVEFGN